MHNRLVLIIVAIFFLPAPFSFAQEPPSSFSQSKKLLADLHEEIGHLNTIYCGCSYERTSRPGGKVNRESCGLETRSNEVRSKRIEWEHVVPASWFGQTRACWKLKDKVYPECAGKSGRSCCEHVNPEFSLAHNDPNNLFPSSGEVNADRSNHPYSEVPGEPRLYGQCDFEMGGSGSTKFAEPGDGKLRGTLARAMLYMSQVYGADVKMNLETVWKWHTENPPEEWEIIRAKKIAEKTGLKNNWILGEL